MGVTLMHEHILLDTSSWWKRPCCASDIGFAERPLDISMIGELADEPVPQSRQLRPDRCQGRDRGTGGFVEYGGQDRGRSDQSRHRPRPFRAAAHQPPHRAPHRDGRGLLPRAVASALRQDHVDRSHRRGDRGRLRRVRGRPGSLRRHHRRDRDQQGLYALRGESAARRRARFADQRRAPLDPPAGLGASRSSRARRRRERGRRSAAYRALPHEPEPARSRSISAASPTVAPSSNTT